MNQKPRTPQSEVELLQRAERMAGCHFHQLAELANMQVPPDLKRDKGWVGQLLEWHLGAISGSLPQPDFVHLGIELKSIPISYLGQPLETTFVCVAPLTGIQGLTWEYSPIRKKLARVLWVPIEGQRDIPLRDRRVGRPFIWSPSPYEEKQLQQDWEELMEWIALGKVETITASLGQYLQLRPKAANSRITTNAIGAMGEPIKASPKGFYLKKEFTHALLIKYAFNQ